jgi:cobalt/nickel transport system ATP-binding protein
MPQPILRTANLSYSYDNVTMALSGVTLDIPKGKKTVFLGPNGAGKSTFFLHLNGVLKPDDGTVFYEGKEVSYDSSSLAELRKSIALVFQNPDDQIFSATVEEDVAFGPLNLGLSREDVERRVDEALSWIGLEDSREKPTQQLSFGERKRVALAGALAMKPNVLVMDEPTAGLDYEMVHELLELSDELNNRGLTVVISTHDVETAYEWADEVRALNAGRLVFSGGSDEFFEQAELLHDLGLMPPLAFLLNQQFHLRTGSPEKPYPRNIVELSQKFFSTTNQSVGKITLVCVDEEGIKQVAPRDDLLSVSHMHSGVFGSTARRIAKKRQLDVHYRFHAVEFGLLAASQGSDFTIYTDSSLCGLVESKVKELEMHTGLHIDVTKASNK